MRVAGRLRHRAIPLVLGVATAGLLLVLSGAAGAGAVAGARAGPKHEALVELGRRLFFDPVVSRSGETACASCHDPEHGFSDPGAFSHDDVGDTLRHSQTVLDSAFNPNAHWDGEFRTIEALVTARIGLPQSKRGTGYGGGPTRLGAGHGTLPPPEREVQQAGDDEAPITSADPRLELELGKLPRAQDVLEASGRYEASLRAAFGDTKMTRARISRAIAAYCRSILHTPAPFDRWRDGESFALGASAARGFELFKGRAGCIQCHVTKPLAPRSRLAAGKRAAFTDFDFHNTGIAWLEKQESPRAPRSFVFDDPGKARLTGVQKERRAFKTPTLRDLTRRGPYMHNGAFASLGQVVRHYAAGGSDDPEQDPRIRAFEASDQDVADLLAFLASLVGTERPGLASAPHRVRPDQTRLRFLDGNGKPLAAMPVRLVPVGDRLPAERVRQQVYELTTDAQGWIAYAPPGHTHMRLDLLRQIDPEGGPLVPDTCAKATVVLPVSGETQLVAMLPLGIEAPGELMAEHLGTTVFAGHDRPRSYFTRTHVVKGDGFQAVRYCGWMRTDVPPEVRLHLPGAGRTREFTLKRGGTAQLDLR